MKDGKSRSSKTGSIQGLYIKRKKEGREGGSHKYAMLAGVIELAIDHPASPSDTLPSPSSWIPSRLTDGTGSSHAH